MSKLRLLPDCVMLDGGQACVAYHEAIERIAELERENEQIYKLLLKMHAGLGTADEWQQQARALLARIDA